MTKAITASPMTPDKAITQNNADAVADLPRALAANAAWVHGYTVGGDTLDATTPNPAPRSPMHGRRGHTHSGGVDGRPMHQTVASFAFQGYSGQSGIVSQTELGKVSGSIPASSTVKKHFPFRLPVWVPGCDPGLDVGSYAFLGISLFWEVSASANTSASDTFKINVRNITGPSVRKAAVGVPVAASWSGNAYWEVSASDAERVETFPGRVNLFAVEWEYTAVAGSTRTFTAELASIEFGVYGGLIL